MIIILYLKSEFCLIVLYYWPDRIFCISQVLDNYIDILRNNQIYLVEKSKLINALAGLAHCLSLIANKGQRDDRLNIQVVSLLSTFF